MNLIHSNLFTRHMKIIRGYTNEDELKMFFKIKQNILFWFITTRWNDTNKIWFHSLEKSLEPVPILFMNLGKLQPYTIIKTLGKWLPDFSTQVIFLDKYLQELSWLERVRIVSVQYWIPLQRGQNWCLCFLYRWSGIRKN